MKQKKQNKNDQKSPAILRASKKIKRSNTNTPVKICMQGTRKVKRDTVLQLCSQVISNSCSISKKEKKKNLEKLQTDGKNSMLKEKKKKTPAMNYKVLKKMRKVQAKQQAAMKAKEEADREKVTPRKGLTITEKMIKAAKEKEAHKQGILHLWGRPHSGCFKAKRKRGGKH